MTSTLNYTSKSTKAITIKSRVVTWLKSRENIFKRLESALTNRVVTSHGVGTSFVDLNHPLGPLYVAWNDYDRAKQRKDTRAMNTAHKALSKARHDIMRGT